MDLRARMDAILARGGYATQTDDGETTYVLARGELTVHLGPVSVDEDDEACGDVPLQVFDATKPPPFGPLRVRVCFTADTDLEALGETLRTLATEVTPSNYDATVRAALRQHAFSLFDGWMKPPLAKSALTAAETARLAALLDALRACGWALASEWQSLFDAEVALSPLLHADKPGGLGPMHLDYFARTDFLELTTAHGQLRLRIFPGDDLAAVIAHLDALKQPLDPTWEPRTNALCRAPILSESAEGWRLP